MSFKEFTSIDELKTYNKYRILKFTKTTKFGPALQTTIINDAEYTQLGQPPLIFNI